MGDAGVASRVLFPALGSLLTYASAGTQTAPGQLDLDEAVALLRRLRL
jgi:3-dehydroquinate dehydratase-1